MKYLIMSGLEREVHTNYGFKQVILVSAEILAIILFCNGLAYCHGAYPNNG